MRAFHLLFAVLIFGVFLATGQYMDKVLDHLQGLEMGERIFYRSRHIYILLAAVAHGLLGAYVRRIPGPGWKPVVQILGSVLLAAATVALVAAFFTEAAAPLLRSAVSQLALYAMPLGTFLHVLAGWQRRSPERG